MGRTKNVLGLATSTVWAIQPEKLDAILDVLEMRAEGLTFTPEEIAARIGDGPRAGPQRQPSGSVAVIPLYGVIAQRMNLMTDVSGGTSTEQFAQAFEAALNNPEVSAIVFDIDSPGGATAGVPELAALIRSARGKKPMYAVANSLMASAAVWIGAQADQVIATPSALVGSIGAMAVHTDESEANAKAGIKRTYLTSAKNKAEANADEPLSDEARQALQALVDDHGAMFVRDLARARGVTPAAVKANYGDGRIMSAKQALDAGLIDRVASLDQVLGELLKGGGGSRGKVRADADPPPIADNLTTFQMAASTGGLVVSGALAAPPTVTAAVGGAAVVLPFTPSVPAPKAKEHSVPEAHDTAANGAAIDLATVQAALVKAERAERITELASMVPSVSAAELSALIKSDKTLEQAKQELFARVGSPTPINGGIVVGADREAEKPFRSIGEQLIAIAGAEMNPRSVDKRLLHINAALATGSASANVPSDGGYAIQQDFSMDLVKDAFGEGSLASQVSSTEVSGNSDGLRVMYIEETSRATGSRWGGVQVYRGAEGDTATAKKPKFAEWEQRVHDLIGLAYVSERLLQDAAALGGVFGEAFGSEFAFTVDDEIIRGNGAGKNLGWLNSQALVTITNETGQVADTVNYENVSKMWARLLPRARATAVWYINQEVERHLQSMQIGTGTSAQLVYMPPGGISGAQYGSIFGRPVRVTEQCSAIGDAGDIILANPKGYQLVTKGGLNGEESIHVRFLTNERTFRWVMRVGGAPRLMSALTPYKGSDTMSDHVTLGAR
jgi:HK97 family phage major capsid protein